MEVLDAVGKVAVIIASLSAIFGINSWRREMRAKKRFELAEEVLSLFYEAIDAVAAMRSPVGFIGEGETRKPGSEESPEQKRALDQAYVAIERYHKNQEVFSKIRALRYRFMAIFGSSKVEPFESLALVLNDIFMASHRLGRLWQEQARLDSRTPEFNRMMDKIEKQEAIFWAQSENDAINQKLKTIREQIEGTCGKVLLAKSNWLLRVLGI